MLGARRVDNRLDPVGNLGDRFRGIVGQDEIDEHSRGAAIRADQPVDQLGFAQRDIFDAPEILRAQIRHVRHEILDDQLVALGPGVGEIGQRIDARRIGQLPALFGQLGDRFQRVGREYAGRVRFRLGGDGDEDRIGFRIGRFQRFEGDELGIVLAEEDAAVIADREVAPAGGHKDDENHRQRQDRPAPAQHAGAEALKPGGSHGDIGQTNPAFRCAVSRF